MRLLLDENSSRHAMVVQLRKAGHDVETVVAQLGPGTGDAEIALTAIAARRVVLTRDCDDFRSIYSQVADHPGLLLVYGFEGKAASTGALIAAIANVDQTYPSLDNIILRLNDFFR